MSMRSNRDQLALEDEDRLYWEIVWAFRELIIAVDLYVADQLSTRRPMEHQPQRRVA